MYKMSTRSRQSGAAQYFRVQGRAIEQFLGRRMLSKPTKAIKAPPGVSKSVVKYVKRSIASVNEPKRYTAEASATLFTSAATQAQFCSGNMVQFTPTTQGASYSYTITQGTGQGQRIGNSIKLKKVWFRFVMYPQQYNAVSNPTPQPQDVRLVIFSMKPAVATGVVSKENAWTVLTNTFFANGNASNGMLGNLYDMVSYPNTDVVTVYFDKVMKLGMATVQGNTGGSATNYFPNNDYLLNQQVKIDITKFLPSKIVFNDNNDSTTRQVFAAFLPVNSDGTGPVSTRNPASYFWGIDLQYIDA